MPRDIPIGNGRLLISFDREYAMRELFYPHVGQENHVFGRSCRLGVWVDQQFSWIGPDWQKQLGYLADTMVTEVGLVHPGLQLALHCREAVDFHEDVYVKAISVENTADREREVRLFFCLDLGISGNDIGDTAGYDPKTEAVIHYKGARYLLAGGCSTDAPGLSQYAVGQKGMAGREGTFRDAEDGLLSGNPMAQGSVDSVIAVHLKVAPMGRGEAHFWVAAGSSWYEVERLNSLVRYKHPRRLMERTEHYWRLWVRKESPPLRPLPEAVGQLYRRSLIIVRSQVDWQGGILAANDSDVLHYNRDTYSYVWPRDGALVAHALDLAGHPAASRNFFRFIAQLLQPEGCLLHKFNPDGTLASSWHPWYHEGEPQLPIQEDSTALVLWALWQHFVLYRDLDLIKGLYRPLVKKAADFMCRYRDPQTGLPSPSYDLWEERKGILSFTVGAVFGGLTAASLFSKVFGEEERAAHYQGVAAEIRDAASRHLWREDLQRFCRMIHRNAHGHWQVDATCDSSLWGLFAFGLYRADDPRVVATMATLEDRLWVPTPVGGMARYEGDPYHRVSEGLPGNPWFICTLWLADYFLATTRADENLARALQLVSWVAGKALPSGVLAEQLNPITGEPLSVSPLTWSHATFITTVHHLLRRLAEQGAPAEGQAAPPSPLPAADWISGLYHQACDSIHGSCRI
jgi:GH15 family glucan-1,4-alpha-glucosidase